MNFKKYFYTILISAWLLLNANILSQDKVFLSSENDYVTVVSNIDWSTELNSYAGTYEFIYPGVTEKGEYEGDAFGDDLVIEVKDGGNLFAYKKMTVEASWEQYDTLFNTSVSGNNLTSSNYSGRFVELKYKTKKGKVKKTYGIYLLHTGELYESFYEKMKNTSGSLGSDNSILLFGKELVFGAGVDEFLKVFPEFKPEANDYFYGTNGDGYELYSIRKEHESDPFKKYWIVAKFRNSALKCMEFHSGGTDEFNNIIKDVLAQFTFEKKETNEELEFDKFYYKKGELYAEHKEFEVIYLNICLK